jgi:hypothetical protein
MVLSHAFEYITHCGHSVPLEEVAHPLDILENAGVGDEKNLVETQLLDPLQWLARFVRATTKSAARRAASSVASLIFGPIREVNCADLSARSFSRVVRVNARRPRRQNRRCPGLAPRDLNVEQSCPIGGGLI